eukprot:11660234-Alexandrium_andersonii.AAC.1
MAANGLPWTGVRMKAHGIQCRPTSGARQSGTDAWHSQPSPCHRPALRVRQAEGRLGMHGSKKNRRARDSQVGPEAPLRLGH